MLLEHQPAGLKEVKDVEAMGLNFGLGRYEHGNAQRLSAALQSGSLRGKLEIMRQASDARRKLQNSGGINPQSRLQS